MFFLSLLPTFLKLWCQALWPTQWMLIFAIIWPRIVCGHWLRTGWKHRWTLRDTTSRPVRIEVEPFLALRVPPHPFVLHSVTREEPPWSMRVCCFPQFRSMQSPCQDKQTRKGENSCWNRSPMSHLDEEGLALARKTKGRGQIVVTGVLKGDIVVLGPWAAKPLFMMKSFSLKAKYYAPAHLRRVQPLIQFKWSHAVLSQ